ncbi:MAG: glycosyltransferase, partial [Methylocystis sp.]|nr:glycosyltransferase [Methylocystis sp.]
DVYKRQAPAREAFKLGRAMVVPSRFESLPYIVLEAAAAQIPLIATNVGGMPEIYGPYGDRLIPCDNPAALAAAIESCLGQPHPDRQANARSLAQYVESRFALNDMVGAIINGYRDALAARGVIGAAH